MIDSTHYFFEIKLLQIFVNHFEKSCTDKLIRRNELFILFSQF
jgi:hypothetical protein